jgi:hypothetical protein
LEVEPAEGRRRIQIRDFIATERLLSFWQKDSRALADIPNGQSILLSQHRSGTCRASVQIDHTELKIDQTRARIIPAFSTWRSETSAWPVQVDGDQSDLPT